VSCNYETFDGTCRVGLDKYKYEYVEPFVEQLAAHANVPVAVIIEPDSLPNLATNLAMPRCGNSATKKAYTDGVGYAIKMLAERAPHAALYLDAGHGGCVRAQPKPSEADRPPPSFIPLYVCLPLASPCRLLPNGATCTNGWRAGGLVGQSRPISL
jgi:hypothetical protein